MEKEFLRGGYIANFYYYKKDIFALFGMKICIKLYEPKKLQHFMHKNVTYSLYIHAYLVLLHRKRNKYTT